MMKKAYPYINSAALILLSGMTVSRAGVFYHIIGVGFIISAALITIGTVMSSVRKPDSAAGYQP
ncbi:hypothetical protein [Acidiphilium acidophilum]|uniref:Uncharacterized protein n=1 Tax=Acidiphilium acidophilum TaxID=76588 RepID=A0AAW9DNV8_ACIAO|nr:hypothetical protein [Acidiphilium acidophilum]MDX5930302.1 hypothetical protein [Acidiphilium acidophilum]